MKNIKKYLKIIFLNTLYFFYSFFFRNFFLLNQENKKIAVFFFGQTKSKKASTPLGEFIIREPFFRYLHKKGNKLFLVVPEKKDFMLLPPFNIYFKKIFLLQEFFKKKEKFDYVILVQNYLNLPFKKIKEKTHYLLSLSHQGLHLSPFLWRYIDYFPCYTSGGRHELQRNFDILNLKINLTKKENFPKVEINPKKRKYISLVLLDETSVKSINIIILKKIIDFISSNYKNKIVLLGDENALPTKEKLMKKLGKNKKIIDKVGKTNAFSLAKIVASSKLIISPDTGTAHLAAALKTPLIVYYTTTVLDRWKPLGEEVYQYKFSDDQFQEKIIKKTKEILE